MIAESRFQRLSAPELLKDVLNNARYFNGLVVKDTDREEAAQFFYILIDKSSWLMVVPLVQLDYSSITLLLSLESKIPLLLLKTH